jgi:endonuclease/exonuclease/phosphatase family metal-dependent hydrolase
MKNIGVFRFWLLILILFQVSPELSAQGSSRIKVMSWNIRLDTENDGPSQWKYRKDALCNVVTLQSPDVLGVQEALHNQMKDMRKQLKGYRSLGVARDDGKKAGEYSAIFYNRKRVKAIRSGTYWLSETPDIPGSRGWDAACNRVVTWAEFREKSSGKHFVMFNTHFDHMGDTARVESAILIISKAGSIAGKLPVILTGDLNVTDKHRAYRILTYPENEVVLSDTRVRAEAEIKGPDFTFVGFDPEFVPTQLIDYIFATWDFNVISNHILDFRQNLPYFSDHLPVVSVLEFK